MTRLSKTSVGKLSIVQTVLLLAFFLMAGRALAAEKLGTVFWNLDWSARESQVEKIMEQQQFVLTDQGKDDEGNWLLFDKGRFMGQPAQVKVRWGVDPFRETKVMQDIAVLFAARGLGTEYVLNQVTETLQAKFGDPVSRAIYWMKSYPPIRVESAVWRVTDVHGDPYNVTLGRVGTEVADGETPADSEVQLMAERDTLFSRSASKSAWVNNFPAPKLIGPGMEGAPGELSVGLTPILQYERVGSVSYVYIFDAQDQYVTLTEQVTQQAEPVLVARVTTDSFTVPEGVLLPNHSYRWYVESIHVPGTKSEAAKDSAVFYFNT